MLPDHVNIEHATAVFEASDIRTCFSEPLVPRATVTFTVTRDGRAIDPSIAGPGDLDCVRQVLAGFRLSPAARESQLTLPVMLGLPSGEACYRKASWDEPGLEGKLELEVDVGPYGRPSRIAVVHGLSPALDRCVATEIAGSDLKYLGREHALLRYDFDHEAQVSVDPPGSSLPPVGDRLDECYLREGDDDRGLDVRLIPDGSGRVRHVAALEGAPPALTRCVARVLDGLPVGAEEPVHARIQFLEPD